MVGFKGANPGGGGIELLSRLAGRSRALEVVLGANRIDADTAALYGCMSFPFFVDSRCCLASGCAVRATLGEIFWLKKGINRAIPDAQFEEFVDNFARRVAGWDHYAIAAAKKLINERTDFPTANQQQESFNSFLAAVAQGAVSARLKAMGAAGLQTNLDFEINLDEEELKFVGDGPWNV